MNNRSVCFRDSQIRSKPFIAYPPPQSTSSSSPQFRHHQPAAVQPPPPPSVSDALRQELIKFEKEELRIQQVLREELRAHYRQKRRTQELNDEAHPPLHHQPPPSDTTSDLLRSQVTPQPPPSSFTSPSPSPLPVTKSLPSISIPPPPGPIWHPPPPSPTPSATPTEPSNTQSPPFSSTTQNRSVPTFPSSETLAASQERYITPSVHLLRSQKPERENPPRNRAFPSIFPVRETLSIPKSPPPFASLSPSPASLPPPLHRTEFHFPQIMPPPFPIPTTQFQTQQHHKYGERTPQQQQIQQTIQTQQAISEKKSGEGDRFEQSAPEEKRNHSEEKSEAFAHMEKNLLLDEIAVPEKKAFEPLMAFEEIKLKKEALARSPLKRTLFFALSEQISDIEIKKDSQTLLFKQIWVPGKQEKFLILLFEQKLEIELILVKCVDSSPTSDVSTIRGRIVFKKGRMIPNIMGLDRGRTRPPRPRLKDRALRWCFVCYVVLCVFMFVVCRILYSVCFYDF